MKNVALLFACAASIAACRSTEVSGGPVPTPTSTTMTIPSAASSGVLPMAATAVATTSAPPTATSTAAAGAGDAACKADKDCAWGEIPKEIVKTSDCMCLFGCPHLALGKATVDRRRADHARLCKPGMDGSGRRCPVDDCAMPGPIRCVAGTCTGAPSP